MRVLDVVAGGTDTVPAVAAALGVERSAVESVARWGADKGLLERRDDTLELTAQGRFVAGIRGTAARGVRSDGSFDLPGVAGTLGEAFAAARAGEERQRAADEAPVRADDADRDVAVRRIEDAYASGALTLDEMNQRTQKALSAITHGELAALTTDLAGSPEEKPEVPWDRVELSFRRVRAVRRALLVLALLVLLVAVLVELR